MEQIRAFIAIELPDQVKRDLSDLLGRIRPGQERAVKWLDPDSIHLTLKFLGNIPAEKTVDIARAIDKAAAESKPFTLELQGLGAFPNLMSPRVVWVGVGGDVRLVVNLQRRIDQALIHLGFPSERREFSPHLTLGRLRDKATNQERRSLGESIGAMRLENGPPFLVDEVCLMRSTLTSAGAIYHRLACVHLTEMDRR
ncbi:MAG: RNA 2',3'-cyclic phosphodiesterase [Dehalococcoidia bacterium]|nr:RNA 2',3'-cyclic phosphodiesterase [Chloroflexota bacterium]MBT9160140.1 RNA 2',3'-cyclic phosphodiesterase [Chloroflexota bacterium]MBT9162212.1 RNA 2',3'-cyclic phosphodiesterase [Chloroflexota bacterium]